MAIELYYWPSIQGRGEFIRLALEAAAADYSDVARESGPGKGVEALLSLMENADRPPFAPPFVRAGDQIVSQTANALFFLAPQLGLAPRSEADRLWLHQLQLTVADFVAEIHNVHHPISSALYYEQQRDAAQEAARLFRDERLPKYMGYFESVLGRGDSPFVMGAAPSYPDLSLFQLVEGLGYAFPATMSTVQAAYPGLFGLRDRVADNPNIAAYLASPRRIPFNEDGIFRHYPELDG